MAGWIVFALVVYGIVGWAECLGEPLRRFKPTGFWWAWWETGALITTGFFTVVFYWKYPFPKNVDGWWRDKLVMLLMTFGAAIIVILSAVAIYIEDWEHFHVWGVFLLASFFLLGDLHLWDVTTGRTKADFGHSVAFIDIPVVVSTLLLAIWQSTRGASQPDVSVFIAGAVAFQLLLTNISFALVQGRGYERFIIR
jgi:hypothetical protein